MWFDEPMTIFLAQIYNPVQFLCIKFSTLFLSLVSSVWAVLTWTFLSALEPSSSTLTSSSLCSPLQGRQYRPSYAMYACIHTLTTYPLVVDPPYSGHNTCTCLRIKLVWRNQKCKLSHSTNHPLKCGNLIGTFLLTSDGTLFFTNIGWDFITNIG